MTNLERLQQAGLVGKDYTFTTNEKEAIESLSTAELDHLVSSNEKLGESLIRKHVSHGMMF